MKKFLATVLLMAPLMMALVSSAPSRIYVGVASDKQVYKVKETIVMALTVLNTDAAAQEFSFNSGQKYDFYLYHDDKLVWKWSGDKMFTQAISGLTLIPDKPLTYLTNFNQTLPSGGLIGPGSYQLKGAFCPKGEEYLSEPITIEIRK